MTGAAIVVMGAAGEPFLDRFRESRPRVQTEPRLGDSRAVVGFGGDIGIAPRDGRAVFTRVRLGDLNRRPGSDATGLGADDEIQVVAHHRIGENVDGEAGCGGADAVAYAIAAVLGGSRL